MQAQRKIEPLTLSRARRMALMTQFDLGRLFGFSQAKMSLLERGQLPLDDETRSKIAEILGHGVDDIEWPQLPEVDL